MAATMAAAKQQQLQMLQQQQQQNNSSGSTMPNFTNMKNDMGKWANFSWNHILKQVLIDELVLCIDMYLVLLTSL